MSKLWNSWEEMYAERELLRAENDALKLRVAVLEKVASEAAQNERAAIIRKIRQDAKISHGLARFTGGGFLGIDLDGLADDLEAGAREQTRDDDE